MESHRLRHAELWQHFGSTPSGEGGDEDASVDACCLIPAARALGRCSAAAAAAAQRMLPPEARARMTHAATEATGAMAVLAVAAAVAQKLSSCFGV